RESHVVRGVRERDHAPAVDGFGGSEREERHAGPDLPGVVDERAGELGLAGGLDGVDLRDEVGVGRGEESAALHDVELDRAGDVDARLEGIEREGREPERADVAQAEAVRTGVEERLTGDAGHGRLTERWRAR